MPLKFSGLFTSPFLYKEIITDLLQLSGNIPDENKRLNKLFRSGKIASMLCLNNSANRPSGPGYLPFFKDFTAFRISSLIISELKIKYSISSSGSFLSKASGISLSSTAVNNA